MSSNISSGRPCAGPILALGLTLIAAFVPGREIARGQTPQHSIVAWGYPRVGVNRCDDFTAVAGGGYYSLGLKADGSIVAWGCGSPFNYGQCNVPAPNTGFVGVAAGNYHSLGLKADGSIVAWGRSDEAQTSVPEPNSGFATVAAGSSHSLGLKGDGSIVAWGANGSGQTNPPPGGPNTGFVGVGAGYYHSLGLKADGSIVAWGDNSYGQTNVPAPNSGFVAVGAGGYHSLGLKADGSIVAWGNNAYGQTNVPAPNSGFVAVAAGGYHGLGLKADGSIVGWGHPYFGQTNVPLPNTGFVAVGAGAYHSLAIRSGPDCNANGMPDDCDIELGTSADCNRNDVPDECDTANCAGSPGCDCNNNGILDVCDIASGVADCQPNGVPDVCELAGNDSNGDGLPDDCNAHGNIVWDTDPLSADRTTRSLRFKVTAALLNAIRVELVELQHPNPRNATATTAMPTQTVPQDFSRFDTNSNGVCSGATAAPNYNAHPCSTNADCVCDTQSCTFNDAAHNGVCSSLAACTAAGEGGGCARWVGKPATFLEAQQVPGLGNYRAARLQCTPFYYNWVTETAGKVCAGRLGATNTGLPCVDNSGCTAPATCVEKKITVVGAEILPSSTYSVRTYGSSCAGSDPALCADLGAPVTMFTRRHGDVASASTPPDAVGQPNGIDVAQIVDAFWKEGPLRKVHAKITPNLPEENLDIGADDIGRVVNAAKGFAYPLTESGPCPCPSTVTCLATPCGCDAGPPCPACGGGQCVKTCTGGLNDGLPCRDNDPIHNHCPGGTCGSGFCRDKCGRCTP